LFFIFFLGVGGGGGVQMALPGILCGPGMGILNK